MQHIVIWQGGNKQTNKQTNKLFIWNILKVYNVTHQGTPNQITCKQTFLKDYFISSVSLLLVLQSLQQKLQFFSVALVLFSDQNKNSHNY